jgi:hypothetical protein
LEGISFSGFVKTIDPASIVLSGRDALRRKMLDVAGAVALSILSYHTQRRHDIRLFKRLELIAADVPAENGGINPSCRLLRSQRQRRAGPNVSPSGGAQRRLASSQTGCRRDGVLQLPSGLNGFIHRHQVDQHGQEHQPNGEPDSPILVSSSPRRAHFLLWRIGMVVPVTPCLLFVAHSLCLDVVFITRDC